jgi:hypothetical protein
MSGKYFVGKEELKLTHLFLGFPFLPRQNKKAKTDMPTVNVIFPVSYRFEPTLDINTTTAKKEPIDQSQKNLCTASDRHRRNVFAIVTVT